MFARSLRVFCTHCTARSLDAGLLARCFPFNARAADPSPPRLNIVPSPPPGKSAVIIAIPKRCERTWLFKGERETTLWLGYCVCVTPQNTPVINKEMKCNPFGPRALRCDQWLHPICTRRRASDHRAFQIVQIAPEVFRYTNVEDFHNLLFHPHFIILSV